MSISPYFTDEDLENQLRLQFSDEKQWDIDFKIFFNQIEDMGNYFYFKIRGREFSIDKITGIVIDLNPKDSEEEI